MRNKVLTKSQARWNDLAISVLAKMKDDLAISVLAKMKEGRDTSIAIIR